MNYQRQYNLLMEKARQRGTVVGYKERHHIVPRCMGGGNGKDNLVELTAREHYVAHRLLYMWYRTPQMAYAWFSMCRKNKNQARTVNSRQYELVKTTLSESMMGHQFSEETRKKLSDARRSRIITDETRRRLSVANKGRIPSAEAVRKMSEKLRGKPKTDECKRKLRVANLGKKYPNRTRTKRSGNPLQDSP